jgi:hypothetical protein
MGDIAVFVGLIVVMVLLVAVLMPVSLFVFVTTARFLGVM